MIICSGCGNPLSDELSFCIECGAEVPDRANSLLSSHAGGQTDSTASPVVGIPSSAYDYSHQDSNSSVSDSVGASPAHSLGQTKTATSKHLILALGGLLIVTIGSIAYFTSRSNSSSADNVAASLRDAIASGRLVTLTGDDAYTYFFRLREIAPKHEALSEAKPQVLMQLRNVGDEIIRKRTVMSLEIITERDWTVASHAYEWAYVLEPNDKPLQARWKYAEGNVARAQARRDDARTSFSAAMQLDPKWAVPVNDFGFLYTIEKNYAEAIPYFQRAINLQADWDIPYNNMGTACFYQKDFATAEYWYRRSLAVNANWATPHVWLGSIYQTNRDNYAAAQEYQSAVNLYDPNRDKFDVTEIQNKANALGR